MGHLGRAVWLQHGRSESLRLPEPSFMPWLSTPVFPHVLTNTPQPALPKHLSNPHAFVQTFSRDRLQLPSKPSAKPFLTSHVSTGRIKGETWGGVGAEHRDSQHTHP